MGRRSTKEDKNIYFTSREEAGLTRAEASERMQFISESRIEKIENEKTPASPEDVLAMASAYKKPELCNYYCSRECRIGQDNVPEVKNQSLAEITIGMVASINALSKKKDRLIEIAEDGKLTKDEFEDFKKIRQELKKVSRAIDSLTLWINKAIAAGELAEDEL